MITRESFRQSLRTLRTSFGLGLLVMSLAGPGAVRAQESGPRFPQPPLPAPLVVPPVQPMPPHAEEPGAGQVSLAHARQQIVTTYQMTCFSPTSDASANARLNEVCGQLAHALALLHGTAEATDALMQASIIATHVAGLRADLAALGQQLRALGTEGQRLAGEAAKVLEEPQGPQPGPEGK
jgi:hypothetical protein